MSLFKRKKYPEIVDFSLMHKKGIDQENTDANKADPAENKMQNNSLNQLQSSSGDFDFLSNLANVGNTKEHTEGSPGKITSSLREARNSNMNNVKINEISNRLDNTEYKINRLLERIKELEFKLRNVK